MDGGGSTRDVRRAGYEAPRNREIPTVDLDEIPDNRQETNSDAPNERMLLPQPEQPPHDARSNWKRWSDESREGPLVSLRRMTYVATMIAGGSNDVGKDDFLSRFEFSVPRYPGMTVTTGFQAHFLDGPKRTDLPPRLYNMSLGFQWEKQVKPGLGLQLGLTPAYYSDFENTGADSFRMMARVIGFYTTSPQTQWVFGFAYLDREDVRALPVLGVIHVPHADLRLDLVFPKPRIARRISASGQWERWGYLSGEYGGGSWGIKRANGTDDIATYSDWKLNLGFEQRYQNGRSLLLEVGYVFNREIEYRDGPGDFRPSDTYMLRAGIVY